MIDLKKSFNPLIHVFKDKALYQPGPLLEVSIISYLKTQSEKFSLREIWALNLLNED